MTWNIPPLDSLSDIDLDDDHVIIIRRTEVDGVVSYEFLQQTIRDLAGAILNGANASITNAVIVDGALIFTYSNDIVGDPIPLPAGGALPVAGKKDQDGVLMYESQIGPHWDKIRHDNLGDGIVTEENIVDNEVTYAKIPRAAIYQHLENILGSGAGVQVVGNDDTHSILISASGVASNMAKIELLQRVTNDLHAGEVVNHNYQDVASNGSEGGIANTTAFTGWTLNAAKAASYSAPALNNVEGWRVFRIPRSKSASNYAVILGGGDIESIPLSGMPRLGSDDDWNYYEDVHRQPADDTVKLQISGHATGYTEFYGRLGPGIVNMDALADAVAARLLPSGSGFPNGSTLRLVNGEPEWSNT